MIIQEWKTFDGSVEQKIEINNNRAGVLILWNSCGGKLPYSQAEKRSWPLTEDEFSKVHSYLICKPIVRHGRDLADYIQWLTTGQPVFFRNKNSKLTGVCSEYFPPFAYLDTFEYSFDDFDDYSR